MMILGLVGKNSAGKGEVAEFLKKIGYAYVSLSDVIRDELDAANLRPTRENLINKGRELRKSQGDSVLADRVRQKIVKNHNTVVDSIRNPAEVASLRQEDKFFLITIEADAKLRFERMQKREREGDPTSFEAFLQVEELESDLSNSYAQQVAATEKLADTTISNEGTIDELHEAVRKQLHHLSSQHKRPSWDDYFMGIADAVATRSNCIKRQVAAVIVSDRRVISTGYNGTPRGVRNCNEGGCPRCNSFAESGKNLTDCFCSHAEENAIVQAAYHGVRVKGATIYTTFSPCLWCTKMILNSGIQEVVYSTAYTIDDTSLNLLKEANVKVRQINHTTLSKPLTMAQSTLRA